MSPTRAGYDVFISYASADLTLAEELHHLLTAAGLKVWFDKARLRPGYDWHKEIEAGCESSRVLLPLLTPRWKQSEWTKFETYGAEAVIPLIVEGAFAETSTPPLARFQGLAIDFSQGMGQASQQLIASTRELLAQAPPEKPVRLADVRYHANRFFVGRERELLQIHEELHQHPAAVLTQGQVRAVTALGGVGKTTLARQYVEKFWRCYPQLFWIDGRLGLEAEFARLCDLLVPSQAANTNVVEKARRALRALEERAERLLVIDNAEDEQSIQAWIPKTGGCRTLITSRFAGWSAAITSIRLNVLEPGPARVLLVTRSGLGEFAGLSTDERAACDELANRLGYLPLALEQAAAYIEQQGAGFGFVDYLRLYNETTRELLAAGVMGSTEYPDSVLTTWTTTTAKLAPGSRAILRLCAFLAPTPLPLTALLGGFEWLLLEAADVAGAPLPAPEHAEFWVREQVRQLRAYSMVAGDATSILLHPLVQKVEQLHLDRATGQHRTTMDRALGWIGAIFVGDPQDVRSWPVLEPLSPHARAVAECADQEDIAEPTSKIMSILGNLHHAKAQFADAEPLLRRALAIDERHHGAEHPDVARDLNNLAMLLQSTNRPADAEPLMRRALGIDERSFGVHHPCVALRLNNLAELLRATNRLADAEPLLERALSIFEQSLGENHQYFAAALNSLAQLLQATNRLTEAEPLMARVVFICEQSLGENHPHVATALNNLAQLFQATNRLAEAEPLMRRALDIDKQSYGEEHPNVARDLNNLAALLQATNRRAEAEPLLRRALAIAERLFGAEHPNVAIHLNNIAQLFQATNRLTEAEPLLRRALAIDEQSYGAEHPEVASELNNLAQLLQATNRFSEAEPLMWRALDIDERSYGADHPVVARDFNNLAQLFQATNRLAEAEPLLRRALAINERSYGPEHPDVATVLNNLALLYQATNRPADAEPLMRRALAIDERLYGAEHPDVAFDLNNLAVLLQATNRPAEAEPLMRRAQGIMHASEQPACSNSRLSNATSRH